MYLYFLIFFIERYNIVEEYTNISYPISSIQKSIFFLHNSIFSDFKQLVISLTTGPLISIIEDNLFINCSNNIGNGGAIYLSNEKIESFINRCCGIYCYTGISSYHGQFSYTLVSMNKNNSCTYSSFQYCSPFFNNDRRSSVALYNGEINVNYLNNSFNYVYYHTFRFESENKISCKYCSIINNYASKYSNILFTGMSYFQYSNFKNNSQGDSLYGLIRSWSGANLLINYCIFLQNLKTLFSNEASTLTISNCWIDNYSKTGVILTNSINLNTETFLLIHFHSFLCFAQNPLTISKTNHLYQCTYNYKNFKSIIYGILISFLQLN